MRATEVPRRLGYFAALRLPWLRRPSLRFPLRATYHNMDACSEPAARASINARRVGEWSPGLPGTGYLLWRVRGLPGYWTVLWARAVDIHPAGRVTASPFIGGDATAFRAMDPLGDRKFYFFEADVQRPTPLRAYASPPPLPRAAQGSLPACRAQLWLEGICTPRTANRISRRHHLLQFHRTSIAWSHPIAT